ncbi:MAG TPA: hypothetical protein PLQ91_08000 [Bacteroidales bacterium]|nr:hypothetical protein [Bacteroidales bacterium]HXK91942.1 hypothetical protein [Bacteroidales bacterium]
MSKKISFILFLNVMIINLSSQSLYFGKNRFGRLELINDSIGIICLNSFQTKIIDTIYYRKTNDTMWISTKIKEIYSTIVSDSAIPVLDGSPVIIKRYKKFDDKTYILTQQFVLPFDSINQQIVFNNMQPPLEYGEILYFCEWPSSKFLVKEPYLSVIGAKYFSIKFNTLYNSGHYFNEFPLKIKKGKLIPISNEAQQKCWINNNYYFPVMKKSKKEKSYYTVAQYRQDMGLQKTNCFRKKPLIIKRNED